MKRLVTQFDVQRTRATVATPTCCCCCCCVASILTASAVTVLNTNDLAGQSEMDEGSRWLYRIQGLVALPFAAAVGIGVGLLVSAGFEDDVSGVAGLVAFFAAWTGLLIALYRRLGLARWAKPVALTIVVCTVLFCLEIVGGIALLFAIEEAGIWLYLGLALALPFLLVPLLRRLMAP